MKQSLQGLLEQRRERDREKQRERERERTPQDGESKLRNGREICFYQLLGSFSGTCSLGNIVSLICGILLLLIYINFRGTVFKILKVIRLLQFLLRLK